MFRSFVFLTGLCLWAGGAIAFAAEATNGIDPFWVLLHEPAVMKDLNLSSTQRSKYQSLLDELDLQFFPLRNQSAEAGQAGQTRILSEVRQQFQTLLTAEQSERLQQIQWWQLGVGSLLQDDVAKKLEYFGNQQTRLQKTWDDIQQSLAAIEKQVAEGAPRKPLEKKHADTQTKGLKRMLEILTPEQQLAFQNLLGDQFDTSQLGRARYKAPELIDTQQWINSRPLNQADLRGKVVIVHFYACGCINCIHNFPWYRDWEERYRNQNVVMIGIQTPETNFERNFDNVQAKAQEEKLRFPILFDAKSENWNAWGNSMWPTVYVIDQQGYLRNFWAGELKWQGSDGEQFLRERIDALLAEKRE